MGSSVVAVLAVCAIFSFGARKLFPIWDDGWLWLLLEEDGLDAILPSHPERAITVWFWRLLAPTLDGFWRNAFLAQLILWPVLALQAALFWRRLFPATSQYAGVVALLTVAPFVTHVQMVTANIALASLISVVLGYGGVLLVLRFIESSGLRAYLVLFLGLSMIAMGVLMQEYAVAVAAGGTVLALHQWQRFRDGETRKRVLIAASSVAATALGVYWIYLRIADFDSAEARQLLNPDRFLDLQKAFDGTVSVLPRALYQGLVGGFVSAATRLLQAETGLTVAILFGALVGLLAAWGTYRVGSADLSGQHRWSTGLALVLGVVAALVPAVVAGEFPWNPEDGMASRFGLPALPILAALVVYLVLRVPVSQLRWLAFAVLGFTAGATAVADVQRGVEEANRVRRLGACLESTVAASEQITVAVIPSVVRSLGPASQWELTARLSQEFPKGLSERLWAYRDGGGPSRHYRDTALEAFGPRKRCRRPSVRVQIRNFHRSGPMRRLLWVEELEDGSVVLESYCRRHPDRVAFRTTCSG